MQHALGVTEENSGSQGGGGLTIGHNHRNFVPDLEDTLLRPYW